MGLTYQDSDTYMSHVAFSLEFTADKEAISKGFKDINELLWSASELSVLK